jgi:4-amino-4-deoxy-L-arabinose transferase-like glycosyltransferase
MIVRRALFFLSIGSVIGYGGLLIWKTSFAVGGSDSSGYANEAKAIATGRVVQPIEALDRLELPDRFESALRPLAYEPGPRPRTMVPYYSPGFPLHLAAAGVFGNWEFAPFFVSPIAALLLVIATYFLGRDLSLSRALAFLCAAILGGSSVLLFQGVQPMSDVVAGLWSAAAVLFALKARKNPRYAAASGLSFGLAVLVRPANVILVLPLALALPWSVPAAALFASGGLPCAAFLGAWNRSLYGGVFSTGYAGQVREGAFGWGFFPERFPHYLGNVSLMLSPLIPFGWLAASADGRIPGRDRAMLTIWFGSYLLLYSFWGPDHAWWYTRYLIPALPGLVIAAVLAARDLLRRIAERLPRLAPKIAAAFLVLVAAAETWSYRTWRPLRIANGERVFPDACELAARNAGGPAVVLSMQFSGALAYYTRTTPVRWDCLRPGDFAVIVEHAKRKGYGVLALLHDTEATEAVQQAPGEWTFLGRIQTATLWRLGP